MDAVGRSPISTTSRKKRCGFLEVICGSRRREPIKISPDTASLLAPTHTLKNFLSGGRKSQLKETEDWWSDVEVERSSSVSIYGIISAQEPYSEDLSKENLWGTNKNTQCKKQRHWDIGQWQKKNVPAKEDFFCVLILLLLLILYSDSCQIWLRCLLIKILNCPPLR